MDPVAGDDVLGKISRGIVGQSLQWNTLNGKALHEGMSQKDMLWGETLWEIW